MKLKKFSVTSLNNYIKLSLESDILLSNVNVEGEVSNLKYHSNGNIYFSLKDDTSKINCIMFSNYVDNLDFELRDGENVNIAGKISVYIKEGTYQIFCYMIERQGVGELYKQFEILKNSLREKGYFDESHKKSIPKICFNIGVITSKTGAVLQDILNVSKRKNNMVNIKVFNSLVQGREAYKDIIQGIRYFNIEKNVDVIIIARGGGSLEDLWAFNNEILAEEIFKSKIPIVSGVGHETDFTICDFVSDLRASTPTAAAEICILDIESIIFAIDDYRDSLDKNFRNHIAILKNRIYENRARISRYSPLNILGEKKAYISNIVLKLNGVIKNEISKNKEKLNSLRINLEKNDFNQVFDKGFALIKDKDGKIIKSSKKIKDSENISLVFKDGEVKGVFTKERG